MRHHSLDLSARSRWMALTIAILGSAAASAQPDLEITSMSLVGTARQGACNTVALVVRNSGNQGTAVVGINTFLATYSQGTPNLNRAERTDMIGGVIQPGNTVPFNLSNVDFKAQGAMTVQALIDSTSKVAESNENNNSRTLNVNVSGSCTNTPPPTQTPTSTCDLKAIFTAPSGSTATAGQPATFTINFTNPAGAGTCPAFKVKLMRSNGRTCSGYGSQVGGSGSWQAVGTVAPGASTSLSFTEKDPSRGTFCYSLGYSPHAYNTQTNSHRPQKVVAFN